jgi:hypothetical protein
VVSSAHSTSYLLQSASLAKDDPKCALEARVEKVKEPALLAAGGVLDVKEAQGSSALVRTKRSFALCESEFGLDTIAEDAEALIFEVKSITYPVFLTDAEVKLQLRCVDEIMTLSLVGKGSLEFINLLKDAVDEQMSALRIFPTFDVVQTISIYLSTQLAIAPYHELEFMSEKLQNVLKISCKNFRDIASKALFHKSNIDSGFYKIEDLIGMRKETTKQALAIAIQNKHWDLVAPLSADISSETALEIFESITDAMILDSKNLKLFLDKMAHVAKLIGKSYRLPAYKKKIEDWILNESGFL